MKAVRNFATDIKEKKFHFGLQIYNDRYIVLYTNMKTFGKSFICRLFYDIFGLPETYLNVRPSHFL